MGTLSASTQFYLYHSSELEKYLKTSDDTARAFCPVHGSDKQRSLRIELAGENRGFAHCHNCKATILIEDINPQAAQRIREKDQREQGGVILQRPVKIVVPKAKPKEEQPQQSYDLPLLKQYRAHMVRSLGYERPRAYLQQRGISYEQAVELGVMYLPDIPPAKQTPELKKLSRWYDHIIFPISSPKGQGFIGRNLQHWQPGMDEEAHRGILKGLDIPPYLKTNPAGYFHFDVARKYSDLIIVEGTFDAMTCLSLVDNVIGLGGTALDVKALPTSVKHITIALDGDAPGRERAEKLKRDALAFGIDVDVVTIDESDGLGKDWNARYRQAGIEGLSILFKSAAPAPGAELTDEEKEMFLAMPEEWQRQYIQEAQQSPPCPTCLDEGKVTPGEYEYGEFSYCGAHIAAAAGRERL